MASDMANPRRLPGMVFPSLLAIGLAAAAFALTNLLQSVVSTAGYVFFYAAVLGSAWFGGAWSGALAALVSIVAVDYYFLNPVYSLGVKREELPIFAEFGASAALVAWFSAWRKQAEKALQQARNELQTRVEERTAELRQSNQQLLAEIAERKRAQDANNAAQAELSRMTRISALGALAASISHEVNQPLAAVVTNADACAIWLASDPPNLEEARQAADAVAREGTRASEVVRRIRALFTKTVPEKTRLDMNDLIREVCALMHAEAAHNRVVLALELAPDLPAVSIDRVQMQQVLANLMQNGIEAMSGVEGRPRRLVIRSERREAGEVSVAVEDSGVGIDPKDATRIFDAFFTTKARGMGMGLSISHSIVEAHGGRLWAAANRDYGATLQFTLPASG